MTDISKNGTTWSSSSHNLTDKNYWISEVIVSSDPNKKGSKKDFTVIVVDGTRESADNNGWSFIRKKSHGNKSNVFKKNKRAKKIMEKKEEHNNSE
jgi:pyridoxal biosynthesis lyase PdxS